MSLFNLKRSLLTEIAALKSLNTGFPSLDLSSSFPSLNNNTNPIDFLIDILKTVVGFEQIKADLIRFLSSNATAIEASIKIALKGILKKYFSCSVDAKLPDFMIDGIGDGFNISINQVDFFNIFKVNPRSTAGELIYGNIQKDLNTFLYDVIQGSNGTWKNLLVVEFKQQGLVDGVFKTNVFNVKIDSSWNGRTVNDFINAYLDSVVLFTIPNFINKLFDIVFGSLSALVGKSKNNVESEVELEILVNKIVDLPDEIIDNGYFDFTPDELDFFNERVNEKTSGSKILKDCNFVKSSVDVDTLIQMNQELNNATNLIEIQTILDNRFNVLADEATGNLDANSTEFGKLNFFESLFKGLILSLANILFAPKIMFLFTSYFKIVSNNVGYTDFNDFLRQNRQFIIDLVQDTLLPLITNFLLKQVIKYVTQLVIQDQAERFKEIVKNQQLQLLSLVGVPQEIRDIIASL